MYSQQHYSNRHTIKWVWAKVWIWLLEPKKCLFFRRLHIIIQDEARHGRAFQGLLERYFGKWSSLYIDAQIHLDHGVEAISIAEISTKLMQTQKCGSQFIVNRIFASICWLDEIRGHFFDAIFLACYTLNRKSSYRRMSAWRAVYESERTMCGHTVLF